MPTTLKRITINVAEEFEAVILKDADYSSRPVASQVVWILKQYYLSKQQEAGLYTSKLHESEKEPPPVVFGKNRHLLEQPSKLHEHREGEKSV